MEEGEGVGKRCMHQIRGYGSCGLLPHPAASYSAHAQQADHVGVMAAGVHDWDGVSILVNDGISGGVIQAGVLLNR